MKLQQALSKM